MFAYRDIKNGDIFYSNESLEGNKDFLSYPYMGDIVELHVGPPGMEAYTKKFALMTKNYEKGVIIFLLEDGAILETNMTCFDEDEFTFLTKEQWLHVIKEYREIHGENNSYRDIEAFIKKKLNHAFSYEQYALRYGF
ncbi:hypothetical protein [Brevibacillus reuszeri]|uniref:hypothetical protein n=1 Tax=Brevibacillus reuszeri TaxID=54915 RepID=UPI000CCBDA6D|nr:hypothetical protein [Brevibacillus reuszeri]